jgi:hypothetical protein
MSFVPTAVFEAVALENDLGFSLRGETAQMAVRPGD